MHIDGDLLSYGFSCGWKQRDPGLGAAALNVAMSSSSNSSIGRHSWAAGRQGDAAAVVNHRSGLFEAVERVCSDAVNGLVWCAAESGARIKAFR
jgi:hypothetical protein